SVDIVGYLLQAVFNRISAQNGVTLDISALLCAIVKRPECGRYPVQLGMVGEEGSGEGVIQVSGGIGAREKGTATQAVAMVSRPFWAKQADRKRREALVVEGGVA
ncbi:MAG TPA: hypothetical protein ACHBY4_13950, partial [Arsenophonus apicola]